MGNYDWSAVDNDIDISRIFEHTENKLAERFKFEDDITFDNLMKLPCLLMKEGTDNQFAYVGHLKRARITGRSVTFECTLDTEIPMLKNSMIYSNRVQLDMRVDIEFHRNHWAVKDIDLYQFLLRNVRPRRQRPSVFKIEDHENIDPTMASAMMPFAADFTQIYESICSAAMGVGLSCKRADDFWENSAVIQDVVSLIDRSRIVVCDCTNRNPNVFYEAGIAHTLGREVILITQNSADIPFDLGHIRHIKYLDNDEGRAELVNQLHNRMQTILGN